MNSNSNRQKAWLSWLFVGALAALSLCVGAMQYRWIGEVSRAERDRLHASLQASLRRLSQDFNWELASACAVLIPERPTPDSTVATRESEYAARYVQSRESGRHARIIKSVFIVEPDKDSLTLRRIDPEKGSIERVDWPAEWAAVRDRMLARFSGGDVRSGRAFGGVSERSPDLLEMPRFGIKDRRGTPIPRETEWLLVHVDIDYIRNFVVPELLQRDLGASSTGEYQIEISMNDDPSMLIYTSDPASRARIGRNADASVRLFEFHPDLFFRRQDPRGGLRRNWQDMATDRGRWLLLARHRAGSLEAVVQKARWRNLSVTTGLLILLMAAMAALVRFTRRAQRLAELQMEFVAGVSHELRTPLSVMRTAGHNLRGRVANDPARVQRYGQLIQEESEKLTAIVEQVLRFANANAGRVIGPREPVSVQELIDDAVRESRKLIDESGCVLEVNIEPDLPPIAGDATALKHVLQNLFSNAVKYGSSGKWIGVFAAKRQAHDGSHIEIRVADHGPGIPAGETSQIFDPFYRGKKATEDQIHGTGLGLSLAKRIMEAHDGAIVVRSDPGKLTEFILRIPAAPVQQEHELANSTR